MAMKYFLFLFVCAVCIEDTFCGILNSINRQNSNDSQTLSETRCKIPKTAPKNIENAIVECQVEIQVALLTDAIELIDTTKTEKTDATQHRKRRSADSFFNEEEKKIAGCLLQCVYRKMKAVNVFGFPTVEGLVSLYTEGITEPEYIKGALQAVDACLEKAKKDYATDLQNLQDNGKTCDVAFDTFDCISDRIDEYCSQKL